MITSGGPAARIFLHGFGQRYELPASLALYLYAAAGVVVISFVLVVVFSADQVGSRAVRYPRRAVPFLTRAAQSPIPRVIGGITDRQSSKTRDDGDVAKAAIRERVYVSCKTLLPRPRGTGLSSHRAD